MASRCSVRAAHAAFAPARSRRATTVAATVPRDSKSQLQPRICSSASSYAAFRRLVFTTLFRAVPHPAAVSAPFSEAPLLRARARTPRVSPVVLLHVRAHRAHVGREALGAGGTPAPAGHLLQLVHLCRTQDTLCQTKEKAPLEKKTSRDVSHFQLSHFFWTGGKGLPGWGAGTSTVPKKKKAFAVHVHCHGTGMAPTFAARTPRGPPSSHGTRSCTP